MPAPRRRARDLFQVNGRPLYARGALNEWGGLSRFRFNLTATCPSPLGRSKPSTDAITNMLIMGSVACQIDSRQSFHGRTQGAVIPDIQERTNPHSGPKCSGVRSRAEPTFSADCIEVVAHKIVDDPTGRNLQVKAQAPENTSFFSGTGKEPCESSAVGEPSAALSISAEAFVPQMTYSLRCQDQNRTTERTASIGYLDFDYALVAP